MHEFDTALIYFLKENMYSHRSIYMYVVCTNVNRIVELIENARSKEGGGCHHTNLFTMG
jgi:hypothetical protein